MTKPREWWIGPRAKYSSGSYIRAYDSQVPNSVHVIEHSAFLELQAENLRLMARVEQLAQFIKDEGLR